MRYLASEVVRYAYILAAVLVFIVISLLVFIVISLLRLYVLPRFSSLGGIYSIGSTILVVLLSLIRNHDFYVLDYCIPIWYSISNGYLKGVDGWWSSSHRGLTCTASGKQL